MKLGVCLRGSLGFIVGIVFSSHAVSTDSHGFPRCPGRLV
jgi:hypothetical protein